MATFLRSARSILEPICSHSLRFKGALAALLFVLPVLCMHASAQTTTISGTVYDPRTTANSLPLPNVLVYATTGTPAALTPGVQCLTSTSSAPTDPNVVSYTNTAVDGTFTLTDVPVNATYTLVIQAGKWRRQFSETVAASSLTGLALHMPSDHTQGDIPLIAIATGEADGLECVFHLMGIADTEFTDDNGTVNPGGRIHLYKGSGSPGADINLSTPSETALMGSASSSALLNSYDMVMFPCQGSPYYQNPAALNNLVDYANAGGRVFTTHFSYVWLDPDSPSYSPFPKVANWDPEQVYPSPDPGVATVNTGFTDGATLSQWLYNADASYNNTPGEIQVSTLRHDFDSVIAPTQPWLTLINSTVPNAVMQFTFNTPVGAPAANQCGRGLYNEYHVINQGGGGMAYPSECPTSTVMTAQEEMLEYALFDLSSFVQPVVVPTLSITFIPSPLIVNQGETGVQLAVNVTNTSSNTPVDGSAVLTLTLPTGVTATALTDTTGGWICTVATLTCTRTTSIGPSVTDTAALTLSVPLYPAGGQAASGLITATASSPYFSNNVTGSDTVIFQQQPAITWATPAPIIYGTALSATQLDASSTLAGSFSYSPSAGTVLSVGQHTLTATFTPTDTTHYTTATATVTLTVIPVTPSLTITASPNPVFLSNPVTFTATISSFATTPTGTVTFYDGTTQLGPGTVAAGIATYTTSALTDGIHSITAVYSGDSSYGPATSGAVSETIQDFTLTQSGSGATAGTVTTYTLVITPVGGATLPGAVSLGVTGLPQGVTGAFTPATVTANSGTTTVTLLVTSPDLLAGRLPRRPFGGGALPIALGLILLPFAGMMRKTAYRWNRLAVLALVGAALAVGLTGCGGVTLTPQRSSLTITAASGPLSHSITANLTVQ